MPNRIVTEMRDYGPKLRRNMAEETLAEALHVARVEAFRLPPIAWADLEPDDRECLRYEASATLDRVEPTPAQAAMDDTFYELAKALTRAAFTPPKDDA